MHIFWARLASFCHLGFISDPLIVSKFHNEAHDPKGQENKIYTIVKGRETFYRRHTVPVTSCSKVKYVLKRVSFGNKDCTKELKLECAYFLESLEITTISVCDKYHNEQIGCVGFFTHEPSLEMSPGLRIRSKVNWVQNNKIIDKTLLSMSSPVYITFIKFTDTIQNVLKICVACITLSRQELSICQCKVI